MLQLTLTLSFTIFSLMFSFLPIVSAMDSNIYVQCSQIFYTSTTPYESNVNSLFNTLVDSASVSNFNKFEISQTDIAYGLFQCRGDLNSSDCRDCVASSVDQLKTTCPMSVGGTIQLEGCFVRYDNTPFFGVVNMMEVLKRCGPSIGYNSDVLNHRDDMLSCLIAENGQYFHEDEFGSIQGVAQCVQDLSLSNCHDCLSEASGKLRSECESSSWGDMYLGTCYYNDRDNSNSSSKNSRNKNKGGMKNFFLKNIGYIIAAVVGGGLTLAVTVSVTNCCNTNVTNNRVQKFEVQMKEQSKKAEDASKGAEEASKKAETASKNAESASQFLKDSILKSEESMKREPYNYYMHMPNHTSYW